MGNIKRLQSYYFECPCCKTTQKRLFEYYAKFHGLIDERDRLENYRDPLMLERVIIDGVDERKTIKIEGEPIFRCGMCYEFFRFDDNVSEPRRLSEPEKMDAMARFKPVKLSPDVAVMNSVAFFDKLLNENGCTINANGEVVICGNNGAVYTFDIAQALVSAFYNNPNMVVNEAYEKRPLYKEFPNNNSQFKIITPQTQMLKDA